MDALQHYPEVRADRDRKTPGERIGNSFLAARLGKLIGWGRGNSIWPAQFGLACCAIEMIAATTAGIDLGRFGSEIFRASPRRADLLIVSGRVSQKMAPVLRTIYDQMPEPKWVVAMGACASTGGVFNNYALLQGVDKIVPVDVYIPGCPPRPEDLVNALMILQERIKAQGYAEVTAATADHRQTSGKSVISRCSGSHRELKNGAMKTETDSAPAHTGSGYHGPVTWDESHPIFPDDFVCGYLKQRGVSDVLAESVAREASRALRELPYWHITASGRIEMHFRLFRTLVDAGHRSHSAKLTGDLLKEMCERQVISTGRAAPW